MTTGTHASHKKYLPWRLLMADSSHAIAQALRTWSRVEQGLPVNQDAMVQLSNLKRFLDKHVVIVHYERGTGFQLVPRLPTDDPALPILPVQ